MFKLLHKCNKRIAIASASASTYKNQFAIRSTDRRLILFFFLFFFFNDDIVFYLHCRQTRKMIQIALHDTVKAHTEQI